MLSGSISRVRTILTRISNIYPGVKFIDIKVELWYEAWKDCDCFFMERKFSSYIQQNHYPPKASHLHVNTDENPALSTLGEINQREMDLLEHTEHKAKRDAMNTPLFYYNPALKAYQASTNSRKCTPKSRRLSMRYKAKGWFEASGKQTFFSVNL
jgi:hypothetical protein